MIRPQPSSTLFPYTTLFRSVDPTAEEAYQQVLDAFEIRDVRDLTGQLDERERIVIRAHYGLGQDAQTLSEIGAGLGLTAERSEEHTSELQSRLHLECHLLLE